MSNYKSGGLMGGGYAKLSNCSVIGADGSSVVAEYLKTDLEGDNVGGLIGYRGEGNTIIIENCSVENISVSGTRKVGGLVGSAYDNNQIIGCSVSDVTVSSTAAAEYAAEKSDSMGIGGLVGAYASDGAQGVLQNCSVNNITLECGSDIEDYVKMGYVTGILRGNNGPDQIVNIVASGTNTGSNTTDDKNVLFNGMTPVAEVKGVQYTSLEDAITAAASGDTVKLLSDVEIVLPESAAGTDLVPQIDIDKNLTLDLAGYTIGYDQSVSDKSLPYTPAIFAILSGNVTITGDGKIDCEAGYNNAFGINVNGGSLTVENGTFLGAITAIQVQKGSLTVNGGVFDLAETVKKDAPEYAKYIINAIDDAYKENSATISVTGGSFIGFDPSDNPEGEGTSYVADGYSAKNINGAWVIDNSASMLTIGFEATDDDRVYNIVVNAADATIINRLNTADLTFKLIPSSADDCSVDYEIAEADKMALINPSENRYEFHFNGKDGVTTDTGAKVTIGQVSFTGYTKNGATVTFEVVLNDSLVTATSGADNIVTYFSADGGTLSIDETNLIKGKEFAIPTHDLTVNIDFNNNISDNPSAYQQMTATISGGDLEAPIVKTFGSDAENGSIGLSDNSYSFTEALSENTAYTVTIEGDGYRTARYTVTMTGDKTLNFWNNVKDIADVVEVGADDSAAVHTTYLAGDIVMNNVIDIYDLSAVVAYFGEVNLNSVDDDTMYSYAKYDLNRDGKIDSKDVAMVLVSWGK